jgi:hypothetical protein
MIQAFLKHGRAVVASNNRQVVTRMPHVISGDDLYGVFMTYDQMHGSPPTLFILDVGCKCSLTPWLARWKRVLLLDAPVTIDVATTLRHPDPHVLTLIGVSPALPFVCDETLANWKLSPHPLFGSMTHGGFTAHVRRPGTHVGPVTKVKFYHTGVHCVKAGGPTSLAKVPHDVHTLKRQLNRLDDVYATFKDCVLRGEPENVTSLRIEVRLTLTSPECWQPARWDALLERHTTLNSIERLIFGRNPAAGLSILSVDVRDALDLWSAARADAEAKGVARGRLVRAPTQRSLCMLADLIRMIGITSTRTAKYADLISWCQKDPLTLNPNDLTPTAVRRKVKVQPGRPKNQHVPGNDFSHLAHMAKFRKRKGKYFVAAKGAFCVTGVKGGKTELLAAKNLFVLHPNDWRKLILFRQSCHCCKHNGTPLP